MVMENNDHFVDDGSHDTMSMKDLRNENTY